MLHRVGCCMVGAARGVVAQQPLTRNLAVLSRSESGRKSAPKPDLRPGSEISAPRLMSSRLEKPAQKPYFSNVVVLGIPSSRVYIGSSPGKGPGYSRLHLKANTKQLCLRPKYKLKIHYPSDRGRGRSIISHFHTCTPYAQIGPKRGTRQRQKAQKARVADAGATH